MPTLPATEGGIQWRGGGGCIIFDMDPAGVCHGRNWHEYTYSLEGLDIFS